MLTAGMIITVVAGVGILTIGVLFLVRPRAIAASFGLPSLPDPKATPWLRVKGIRDSAIAVVVFALLFTASPHTVAVALLALSIIPAGDAIIVWSSGGSRKAAVAIHGSVTALLLVAATTMWLA